MLPALAHPAALLGLALLALPVLIHMLVRNRAPVVRLPTLRFLEGEPPVALRRSRPDEPLLLALRLLLLALAVVALARPYLPAAEPPPSPPGPVPRAILVDESRSMTRSTPSGEVARVRARALADSLAGFRTASDPDAPFASGAAHESETLLLPFGADRSLSTALTQAVHWLETRPEPGELILVSDFHDEALDPALHDRVPPAVLLSALPLPVEDASDPEPWVAPLRAGDRVVTGGPAGGGADPGAVRATWTPAPGRGEGEAGEGPPSERVRIVSLDPADPGMEAMDRALLATGAFRIEGAVPVEVRFGDGREGWDGVGAGGEDEADAAGAGGTRPGGITRGEAAPPPAPGPGLPPLSPEAADLLLRLLADLEMAGLEGGIRVGSRGEGSPFEGGLALELLHPPGSLQATLVLAALGRATLSSSPGREGFPARGADDPTAIEGVARWNRPADPDAVAAWRAEGPPGVRWVGASEEGDVPAGPLRGAWFLVLGLLGVETLYRRRIRDRRG